MKFSALKNEVSAYSFDNSSREVSETATREIQEKYLQEIHGGTDNSGMDPMDGEFRAWAAWNKAF